MQAFAGIVCAEKAKAEPAHASRKHPKKRKRFTTAPV
jgi:hypothetical protein